MEEIKKENKMGIVPIPKLLFSMALPLIISMLVQALYNIVDSMFVSFIPDNQISFNAVSLASPMQNLLIAVGTGIGVGMNAMISKALGEKNQKKANRYTHAGFVLAFFAWLIFIIVGICLPYVFLKTQTTSTETIEAGVTYLRIVLCGSIFVFFQFCLERMLQATGRANLSMVTQISGAITNIILDPIFIFTFNMGIAGAAFATVIGQGVGVITGLILNFKYNKDVSLLLKNDNKWVNFDSIKAVLKIGLPSTVMVSVSSILGFGINALLNRFTVSQGEEIVRMAQNAYGAYLKLQSFVLMPAMGLNNALVPIVGFHYGARNKDKMLHTLKLTLITALIMVIVGLIIFQTMPRVLLSFFNADEKMKDFGEVTLRIISLHFLFAGIGITISSWFQALGNGIYSMIVSLFRQLIGILPIAYLLSLSNNIQLIWWAFPIAEILGTILSLVLYKVIDKKIIKKI